MSIEEKYNKALNAAKDYLESGSYDAEFLKDIFPELEESEDERIRENIVSIINQYRRLCTKEGDSCDDINECLAWLEKQKEQKQEWSEVELEFRGEKVKVKRPFFRDDKGRGYSTTEQDDEVTWNALRAWAESHGHTPFELYPREEWSEEDKKMIDTIVYVLGQYIDYKAVSGNGSGYAIPRYSKEIDWLKSLRPSWRPTEEQMNCLCAAVDAAIRKHNESVSGYKPARVLKSLYEQLKKL